MDVLGAPPALSPAVLCQGGLHKATEDRKQRMQPFGILLQA